MKIGIMGGTFDPIHNAHLMLAEYAYRKYRLDEVWFMPNGNPPHKQNQRCRTDAGSRAEMVRLAIAGREGFRLEEYEIRRKEISYSMKLWSISGQFFPGIIFILSSERILCFPLKAGCIQSGC